MAEKMLHFFKDKPPTLEEAQAIVGGLVEMVPLMNPENMQLLINEEHDATVELYTEYFKLQTQELFNKIRGIEVHD